MRKGKLLIACFFICASLTAQQYPFVQYTPKDGLVNSRVRKAYQDSKGRMYFATYSGLSVFDGARFRNYTIQNGLATDLVNDVLEIGDDTLLVAVNTTSVHRLIKGKISRFAPADSSLPLINHFYKRNKNEIYASSDDGLYLLKDNRFRELNISPLQKSYVQSPYLGTVTGLGDYLIIATNDLKQYKGLYLYNLKTERICDMLPDKTIAGLAKDEENRIWVSLIDSVYNLDTAALLMGKLSLINPAPPFAKAKNYATGTLAFDNRGAWFAVDQNKIIHVGVNGEVQKIPLPELIITSGVRHLFIDREHTIWLCNDGAGVFKLVNVDLFIAQSPTGNSMSGYHRAFCVNDITWYTGAGNKIFRKSPEGMTAFTGNIMKFPNLFHQDGKKLLAYDSYNIYEGEIQENTKKIVFHKLAAAPAGDNFGKVLILDPYGNILASLHSGLGVWKNGKLVYRLPFKDISDLIEGLEFDKNNLLWVVPRYEKPTVYTLHPEDSSKYLQPYFRIPLDTRSISPRSSVIDRSGVLWIGTRNYGLIAYRQEGNQWNNIYHLHSGNGLMDNFVTALACDSFNNIIVGTQTGLDRITRDTADQFRVENLTKSSNFFAYMNQVWADGKNHCYALTSTGSLLEFLTSAPPKLSSPPQLIIEEVRVNAHGVNYNKSVFSFKENNISLTIAAPSFIDEGQISYSYLLEGSGNKQWSDTTTANAVINLINLSAGNYELKVKAFFPSTSYLPAEMSYAFEIKPPWWQTWAFRIPAGVLFVGLLIAGLRYYYRNKLRQQRSVLEKQQAVEKERTRIATDMHDDLGAGLSRIKFLSETIGLKKQRQLPVEEDISKIREYSHEMIDKMGEIVWALNEKNDSLSDLLSYTRSYAVEYLSQNGIQCTVNIPEQVPSYFVSGELRRNIFLAVKEILHNVVKHAQANHVWIEISLGKTLAIQVRDDGIGFDRSHIRPFSNGLANMEKRMKDIGGTINIDSGGGTTVSLEVELIL